MIAGPGDRPTFTSGQDFREDMVDVNSQTAVMKIVTASEIDEIDEILIQHSRVVRSSRRRRDRRD